MQNSGKNIPFERIRRITGYLVGTIDKWNDAKKAEESERVKHTTAQKHHDPRIWDDSIARCSGSDFYC